jgi:hypothetical protein
MYNYTFNSVIDLAKTVVCEVVVKLELGVNSKNSTKNINKL